MNLPKYVIKDTATISEALVELNGNAHKWQTLFIIDRNEQMIGTLTDGDIRRGLIEGAQLTDNVCEIMHRDFRFVHKDKNDPVQLKELRNQKIQFIPVLDDDNHIIQVFDLKKYQNILPFDAVLMAGGKGERLRPLTEKMPKPLIKVGDKAIIDYNIERLISYGIKNINVTINYLGEQLEEHFSTPINGIKVDCVREPKYLGTIGSIQFVKEFHNDTILVMNSDLFTNIDYEDFYLHFKEHDAEMSVAAVPYNVSIPFGIFELDGRDILGIREKPTYHYYANAGIYLIKKEVLKYIPNNEFFNATDLIEELVRLQMKVIRFPITGYWVDIGQHSELKKAEDLVKHLK